MHQVRRELILTGAQLHCGISVVDGKEWELLKKYNVNELYSLPNPGQGQGELGSPKNQTEDNAPQVPKATEAAS